MPRDHRAVHAPDLAPGRGREPAAQDRPPDAGRARADRPRRDGHLIGRDGYFDPEDDSISLLDAFYYSTVTITTTGYGDVRPVSDEARLLTTIVVTPARVLFLILLVGTTLEILAERSRHAFRVRRWRKHLRDHTIICGYGTKGRSAAKTLLGRGIEAERIVVIDPTAGARMRADDDGLAAISGDASTGETLAEAGIAEAVSVVVAVDRDDTAILITLTARELNPKATIVAAVREEENVHLLHQGGADGVITSSAAAGRLLGLSSETPAGDRGARGHPHRRRGARHRRARGRRRARPGRSRGAAPTTGCCSRSSATAS